MPVWLMQTQSVLIVLLMIIGIKNHAKRRRHAQIMYSAMIWDILLILQIQIDRRAVQKAAQAMSNPMILNIHVSIAVATVVMYIFMVRSGQKVMKTNQGLMSHKKLGYTTMILRLLTLITSFFAVVE